MSGMVPASVSCYSASEQTLLPAASYYMAFGGGVAVDNSMAAASQPWGGVSASVWPDIAHAHLARKEEMRFRLSLLGRGQPPFPNYHKLCREPFRQRWLERTDGDVHFAVPLTEARLPDALLDEVSAR